ncbi:MAG: hypothetical protein LBS62_06730 [Clostridiales bacterium]|jgi:hypothetical protein|nr:hypothetical protein [Clostridiales bacterium]
MKTSKFFLIIVIFTLTLLISPVSFYSDLTTDSDSGRVASGDAVVLLGGITPSFNAFSDYGLAENGEYILVEESIPLALPVFGEVFDSHMANMGYEVHKSRYIEAVPYIMRLLGADSDSRLREPSSRKEACFVNIENLLRESQFKDDYDVLS